MNANKMFVLFVISILTFSCSNIENKGDKKAGMEKSEAKNDIKEGGLYVYKTESGKYKFNKVLVYDDEYKSVHIRPYDTEYEEKPKDISSKDLEYFIGHIPLSIKGFQEGNPELIKVEEVTEEELEGYRYYLDAMQSQ